MAIQERDRGKAMDWAEKTVNWSTLCAVVQHAGERKLYYLTFFSSQNF